MKWYQNLAYKLVKFMQGRYGPDELSRFLSISAIIVMILSYIKPLRLVSILSLVLIGLSIFRTLSKNIYKRRTERDKYLKIKFKVKDFFTLNKNKFRDIKSYRYYKCPNCKANLRIPKQNKKKKIMITCPKCKNQFTRKVN